MQNFGRFTPSNYIAPNQPLQVTTGVNLEYIRIINNSPYMLSLNFQGVGTIDFPEHYLEDIPMSQAYRGSFTVTASANLTNIPSATSNLLSINGYNFGELKAAQSQPLSTPAVNATASGKPIFSATVGFGATATKYQTLNIFNPPDSGVNFTFYAARVFTDDNTVPAANLITLNGADLNLGTGVSIFSHDASANPPVSFGHATSEDLVVGHGGNIIEVMDMNVDVTQDFLDFPDSVELAPGNNLFITLTSGSTGHVVRLTMKWTEDIAVAQQGGVITTVATSINNQGNPAPTPVVQASPDGDSGVAVLLNNNGQLTLGDATYHGLLSILAGANGDAKVNGTSGTATLYQPWRGDVKLVVIELSGFANAGTGPAINLAIPVPFTKGAAIVTGDNNNTNMLNGGNAQSMTTYPWGGAFSASGTTIGQWANGECNHPIDTVSWPNSQTTLRNGRIIILGT
jgi:hypothetical protein